MNWLDLVADCIVVILILVGAWRVHTWAQEDRSLSKEIARLEAEYSRLSAQLARYEFLSTSQAPDDSAERLTRTCETAMLAILQANGGFPGQPGDDVGRQLVREIRKMYRELERPTPEPPARSNNPVGRQAAGEDLTDDELEEMMDYGDGQ